MPVKNNIAFTEAQMRAISQTPLHDLVEVLVLAKHRAAHDLLPKKDKSTKAMAKASAGNPSPVDPADVTQEAHDHDPPSEGADGSFFIDFDYSETQHAMKSFLPISGNSQQLSVWRVNNGHTQISVTVETTDLDTRIVRNYMVTGVEPQVIIEVEKKADSGGWVLADVVTFLSGTLNSAIGFGNPDLGKSPNLQPQKNKSVHFTHLGFGKASFRVAAISIGSVRIVPEGPNHKTRFKILPWHPVKVPVTNTGTTGTGQHSSDLLS